MGKKIALALGSGGARGFAHIGVLKILEKNNVKISAITGTSMGALVGGLYAAFQSAELIEKIALSTNWKKVLGLTWDFSLREGIIGGDKIENFIREQIGHKKFNNLEIPFATVATDLKTGKPIQIKTGDVASAIRASISVPLIFKPIKYHNKTLADGGLSMPVPVKYARELSTDKILAVNVDAKFFSKPVPQNWNMKDVAQRSMNILRHHLGENDCEDADITLKPDTGIEGFVDWRAFLHPQNIIRAGEKAALHRLKEIKTLLTQDPS